MEELSTVIVHKQHPALLCSTHKSSLPEKSSKDRPLRAALVWFIPISLRSQ